MAGESKEIKIRFTVDESSARQVNSVLDSIIKKATQLGHVLQGVGGGGGLLGGGFVGGRSPGPQSVITRAAGTQTQKVSFASVLGQNVDAFKRLSEQGGTAMKAMSDAVQRGISGQQREISKLQASLNALIGTYDRLGASASGAIREGLQGRMLGVQSRISGHETQLHELQGMAGDMGPPPPKGFLAGTRAFLGGIPWAAMARSGGLAMGGVVAISAEERSQTRAYSSLEAARGNSVEDRIRSAMGGDTRFLMGLKIAGRDRKIREELKNQTSGPGANIEAYLGASKASIASILSAAGIGSAVPGGIAGGFMTGAIEGGKAQQFFNMTDQQKQKTALLLTNMAQEHFMSTLDARVSAMRTMGFGGLIPKGTGLKPHDAFGDLENQLANQGLNMGHFQPAFTGLRNAAGGGGLRRDAWMAMMSQVQGYAGFEDVIGAARRSGAGSRFALGAIGGGINRGAGIQLGLGVAGGGFDIRGTTTGLGALAAIQNGMGLTGEVEDYNRVQRGLAGLQAGDQITMGGIDQYQQGRNLISAMNIIPSGTSYAKDYLANGMTFKQMLDVSKGGEATEGMTQHNISSGQVQKQLGNTFTSVFERYKDEGVRGDNDPVTLAVRRLRASKLGGLEYFQQEKDTGVLNALAQGFTEATGIPIEAAKGAIGALAGTAGTLQEGVVGGGLRKGSVEETQVKNRATSQKSINNTLKIISDDFNEISGKLGASVGILTSFGDNLDTGADDLRVALEKLVGVIDDARTAIQTGKKMKKGDTNSKTTVLGVLKAVDKTIWGK